MKAITAPRLPRPICRARKPIFLDHKQVYFSIFCTETPELDTECEIVWCKLNIIGCRTWYLGSFYRPPNRKPEIEKEYLEAFNQSLTRIMSNKNAHVLIGGDFNCGNIEWSTMQVPEGVPNRRVQSQLLEIVQDHCLSQVVNIHTREDKTLDLLLTNSPSPVNRVKGMPPIGKADHDIVYVEYDIKAKRIQQAPRKIFLYERADMDGLRDHLARFRDAFLSSDHSHMSVNDMWVSFKSDVIAAIERFIPTKMTKTKYSLPWIDSSIRRLIRKREKLYFRARKSSKLKPLQTVQSTCSKGNQRCILETYFQYKLFSFETESPDPDSPRKNEKAKKLWSFVKSLKNDAFGINTLRENGILKTDTIDKANICYRQFQSAFTRESDAEIPFKGTSPFTPMGEITVDHNGVLKLFNNLKINKASGPDGLSARVLKECSSEIAPILALIYNESLAQGTVPDDWRQANVAPIFKKGEKYDAANYRPVSLTCICCKTLEHIIVSNINKHLAFESILADCQHGFRSQRSC